jgi:selT/selW/selH-like putative selenoprotein
LAEEFEKKGLPKPEMIKSRGGAFEVRKNGVLLFSKLQEKRFPDHQEVINLIEKG